MSGGDLFEYDHLGVPGLRQMFELLSSVQILSLNQFANPAGMLFMGGEGASEILWFDA
jgi:hypothetical protein